MKSIGKREKNDIIGICGRIAIPPVLDRIMTGTVCPVLYVDVTRKSGRVDRLPVAFPVDAIDIDRLAHNHEMETYNIREMEKDFYIGREIMVIGSIRTYSPEKGGKIYLFIWAEWVTTAEGADHQNGVELTGKLCRDPQCRKTPGKQSICELILKIGHGNRQVSVIPVIAWNKTAKEAAEYTFSQRIKVLGRLQSRVYYKYGQPHTTYEVAAYKVEKLD